MTPAFSQDKPFILYGAGWIAEAFFYRFAERKKIIYVVDEKAEGDFHGMKISHLDEIQNLANHFVLVATGWAAFLEIKEILEQRGLCEFEHFCYMEAYVKKIAIVHANCYGRAYIEYLSKSQSFTDEYFIYKTPWLRLGLQYHMPDALLKHCDLFIHQDLKKDNRIGYFVSDEYVLPKLKPSCKIVVVPNLVPFARCLYPSIIRARGKPKIFPNGDRVNFMPGNRVIEEAYREGLSVQEIAQRFSDEHLLSKEEQEQVRQEFHDRMKKLKIREAKWDVKISDFIEEHYRTMKLFVDYSHVSQPMMREICRRIGKVLGLKDDHCITIGEEYTMVEMFVMPCVKKALGLTFEDRYESFLPRTL